MCMRTFTIHLFNTVIPRVGGVSVEWLVETLRLGFPCSLERLRRSYMDGGCLEEVVTESGMRRSFRLEDSQRPRLSARKLPSEPTRGTEVDSSSRIDRKSTRLNSSHVSISYAVFCLKK